MEKKIKVGNTESLVDEDDYMKFNHIVWSKALNNRNGYIYARDHKTGKYLHREIMGVTDPKKDIDHINMNTLDNRKSNLRFATPGQNAINRPKQKNNTSGYKGVFVRKEYKHIKYRAAIRVNQKLIHIGQFNTVEEAALAYNKVAIKYFGEFAYLNTIKEKE